MGSSKKINNSQGDFSLASSGAWVSKTPDGSKAEFYASGGFHIMWPNGAIVNRKSTGSVEISGEISTNNPAVDLARQYGAAGTYYIDLFLKKNSKVINSDIGDAYANKTSEKAIAKKASHIDVHHYKNAKNNDLVISSQDFHSMKFTTIIFWLFITLADGYAFAEEFKNSNDISFSMYFLSFTAGVYFLINSLKRKPKTKVSEISFTNSENFNTKENAIADDYTKAIAIAKSMKRDDLIASITADHDRIIADASTEKYNAEMQKIYHQMQELAQLTQQRNDAEVVLPASTTSLLENEIQANKEILALTNPEELKKILK